MRSAPVQPCLSERGQFAKIVTCCCLALLVSTRMQGHTGQSAVVFRPTPEGYEEAEKIAQQYKQQGRGKAGWLTKTTPRLSADGKRLLFAYLAEASDVADFNRHSGESSRCSGSTTLGSSLRTLGHSTVMSCISGLCTCTTNSLVYNTVLLASAVHWWLSEVGGA